VTYTDIGNLSSSDHKANPFDKEAQQQRPSAIDNATLAGEMPAMSALKL
jgi:hypothetical protein